MYYSHFTYRVYCVSGRAGRLKPEVATAVIELLMMGGKKPETC
jgi:hypothetical protein